MKDQNDLTCKAIRVECSEDLQKCHDIRYEVFSEEQKIPENLDVDEWDHASYHILVCKDQNPAGTGRIRLYKDGSFKLERIATRKPFRNKGIGRIIVNSLVEWGKELDSEKSFFMHAQYDSVGFYRNLGWQIGDAIFLEAEIKHCRVSLSPNI